MDRFERRRLEEEILRFLETLDWARLLVDRQREITVSRPGSDQSMVDVTLHEILSPFLRTVREAPVASEEAAGPPIDRGAAYWSVDPLDGTSEFRAGVPEYAVSIAFVAAGVPCAGVIFNPATREYFSSEDCRYPRGERARDEFSDGDYLVSRSEHSKGMHTRPGALNVRHHPMGSAAYKLGILAAEGLRIGLVSYQPKSVWDVAAGAAILRNRFGETLRCLDGSLLSFDDPWGRIPSLHVPPRRPA